MYCTIVKIDTKYNLDSKYNFIYVKIFIYNVINKCFGLYYHTT